MYQTYENMVDWLERVNAPSDAFEALKEYFAKFIRNELRNHVYYG